MGSNTSSSSSSPTAPFFPSYIRKAHHAGSWYSDVRATLNAQLSQFLADVPDDDSTTVLLPSHRLRAVICPHAGYSYSGPTAAHAYKAVAQAISQPDSSIIQTILVLHPSHHQYLDGCAVSGTTTIQTPLGDLMVDSKLRNEILCQKGFTVMTQEVDEKEHSGEMQYPYLAKAIQESGKNISVLPVMCGSLSTKQETQYGERLAEIIARPSVLTVVSSDFCHWGARFRFSPTPAAEQSVPIHTFIEQMDRRGMNLIELQQPGAFADYLKETKNTICGRHAIAVWMRAVVAQSGDSKASSLQVRFVKYAQSSAAKSMQDSSVSYAAAVATIPSG